MFCRCMKNVAIINICNDKSTGKIAMGLFSNFRNKGYNTFFYYGRGDQPIDPCIMKIDTDFEVYTHVLLSRITGKQGAYSWRATAKLLCSLSKNQIDTIFLVNPHGYYLNERMLFNYIAKKDIRLVYTLIDEYAYLGACTNEPECKKYMTGEGKCPDIKKYPKSLFIDSCGSILKRKRDCYKKMHNAIFVGPEFLINNASKSLLGQYMNMTILDEAIDTDFYQPCDSFDLVAKLSIDLKKKIVLCIANTNNPLKGADFFIEAAKHFSEDDYYVFVHVGYRYSDSNSLPSNYIPIRFVEKDEDLAKLYSMADVLVYTSVADAMSNVCLEALACGTPLICFDISGMPYLMDETVGKLVPPRNISALVNAIKKVEKKSPEMVDVCRKYALRRYNNKEYADKLIKIAKGE